MASFAFPNHLFTGKRRRGFSLIWGAVVMIAFSAICSLAVDVGHVQLAKTELVRSADAAARAAAAQLYTGTANAQATAISVAAQNLVDGTPLTLLPADIQCGRYDSTTGAFDTASSSPNAVRISARRIAARSTAIPLTWGKVVGMATCDVQTTVMAYTEPTIPYGLVGMTGVSTHNNLFAASYNSSVTSNPSTTVYYSNGLMGSNGAIAGTGSGNNLYGKTTLGPSGSSSGITVSGGTTAKKTWTTPTMPSFTPVTNPFGLLPVQNAGGGYSMSLPGGTYYFTSVTASNDLNISFTGPATIFMDGNFTLGDRCTVTAYNSIPTNLTIYQNSGYTFTMHDNCRLVAQLVGPSADFIVHDRCEIDGALFFDTLTFHDNCELYLDESLANSTSTSVISMVQ
jgi:Flp pilus assembly protein TadG